MSTPASTPTPYVVETTAATFERDVVERSKEVPVVLDFWAKWCQPCRMLSPLLERLAEEYKGGFILVKADTDALPEHASAFGVRSIPTVLGLRDGQILDGFTGLISEKELRAWIDRLLPTPAERKMVQARALEGSDPDRAETLYLEAIALDPKLGGARVGLGRIALARGRLDDVGTIMADLEARGYLEPEAEKLKAEWTLRRQAAGAGSVEAARGEAAANPKDKGARLRLAEALVASGQLAEALEIALDLVESDRAGTGEEARKLMVAVFQTLPPDSPLLAEYQRRLSVAL